MSGQIILGPILGFRGAMDRQWFTSALVVTAENPMPPILEVVVPGAPGFAAEAVLLKSLAGRYVWRLDWQVTQEHKEQLVEYRVNDGAPYRYVVPEYNKPLRICYGSCFGVSHLQDFTKVKNKNTMWKVLQRVHQEKPYHLFFLGGDQIYSDQVWDKVLPLRDWLSKKFKKRVLAPFTPDMEEQVEAFYFDLYLQMWGQKHPAALLSQIPTLMMWDDHDIFDGWGSYTPVQQECPVFKGVFKQARDHFRIFQLQAQHDTDFGKAIMLGEEGYTYGHRIGDLALVALDLRSERTQKQVMSPGTWDKLQNWLQAEVKETVLPDHTRRPGCKHLLVMSGIPIVNADLTLLETALELRPGQQRMEDDLKDQWLSRSHRQERLQLIKRLLQFSQEANCRVTLISGDAHLAFHGFIQSEEDILVGAQAKVQANVINQLTSSAMVNLPPPALVVYMMEKLLAGKVEEVDRGITARLLQFPGTSRRIIGARNWLSLTLDEEPCIRAEWYVEGEEKPFTKVIHPVGLPPEE